MPRLKTALTGARRCATWATSSPPRDTAMAWPAGSRAMLATTMPSYRFSISRAPRWGRRSPAISEAAVSTSRAASLGHTERSQEPGSSRTAAPLATRPAVATIAMNHRSRGGSPLKVIPPSLSALGHQRPGAGRPAARRPAPGRPAAAGQVVEAPARLGPAAAGPRARQPADRPAEPDPVEGAGPQAAPGPLEGGPAGRHEAGGRPPPGR